MPTATLIPVVGSGNSAVTTETDFSGGPFVADPLDPIGAIDPARCLTTSGPAYLFKDSATLNGIQGVAILVDMDTSFIPLGAIINSVEVQIHHQWDDPTLAPGSGFDSQFTVSATYDVVTDGYRSYWDQNAAGTVPGTYLVLDPMSGNYYMPYTTWTLTFATNPIDGLAWTLAGLAALHFGLQFEGGGSSGTLGYEANYLALVVDYTPLGPLGYWYESEMHLGYQFFSSDPGPGWRQIVIAPAFGAVVLALQRQPCPWFFPTYIIRLTDPAVYADLVNTYGLGTSQLLLGLSPTDAVAITGAPLNQDPSNAAQSAWPQVYVDPAAPFVLGVAVSLDDGGGTVAASYATPYGRPCDHVLWKWQALVELGAVVYDTNNPAPHYTTIVAPGAVPDGAFLNGGPGFGNNAGGLSGGGGDVISLGPCGCPPE